jgi:hypothetical protein
MKIGGAIAGVWFALGSVFLGADLTARLTPLSPQARVGAPEWVEVEFTSRGTGLHEGVLEMAQRVEGEPVYSYRTRELALAAGTQRFRFLLPAGASQTAARSWKLRFIESARTVELGEFSSTPRLSLGRTLVLGIVRSGVASETPSWQALRVERFTPPEQQSVRYLNSSTTPLFLDPEDLPVEPAGYCAFDALLLDGDALSRTREKARAALARWVHAGGSLAIIAPTGLEETHLAFLNQLGAPDPEWRPLTTPFTGVLIARANFGRLLVTAGHPPEELPAEWRQAVGFLWKLRGAPLRSLASGSTWQENTITQDERTAAGFDSVPSMLVQMLVPHRFRPLPVEALWMIALTFIAVVGPLDWWLLGTLRRRRWTWISFPCAALAFTLFTVALARGFLGNTTGRGDLVITDLGTDGRVVRETRIDLTVPVSEGEISAEIKDSLAGPIPVSLTSAPRYHGQFPSRFRLTLNGRQWTPVLWRTTTFEPGEDTSGVAWHAPEQVLQSGFNASLHGTSHLIFDTFSHGRQRSTEGGWSNSDWYRNLVIAPRRGTYTLFSGMAPTGSSYLGDLPCLDNDSTDTSVVVAFQAESTSIHIWRHLFLH